MSDNLGKTARKLRRSLNWSTSQAAEKLGISYSRLTKIESGLDSVSGVELIAFLNIFNVGIDAFTEDASDEQSIQNSLAQFGAFHFRRDPKVVIKDKHSTPRQALAYVLHNSDSYRHITALAPVLVWSIDSLALPDVQHQLSESGLPNRLGWLVQNTLTVTERINNPSREWRRKLLRSSVVLSGFLEQQGPRIFTDVVSEDILDLGIRSIRAANCAREDAHGFSRRWGILTQLQPEDFETALKNAQR